MKRTKRLAGILVAAGLAWGSFALADAQGAGRMGGHEPGKMGPGRMMGAGPGPGMMGGHGMGMMGGHGHGMSDFCMMMGQGMVAWQDDLAGIELDDGQRRASNAIRDELRRKRWDLMGRILDEQSRLRELYDADKRDPTAIGAVYQRIFDLERQMIEAGIEAHNRIEELLTAEQRRTMRSFRGQGWHGRMMGP